MAYREFDTPNLSRRALLRGGAWLTAGAALAGTPMGRVAMAREGGAAWQNVDAMVRKYVDERKVANMVATLGWGRKDPLTIARGTLALGGAVAGVAPALPAARSGIAKLLGPDMQAIAGSMFVLPAIKVIVVPLAGQMIEPADCPKLDKIVSNLAPLPPKNLAGVFVGMAQLDADRRKSGPKLPLCPMARPK